MMLLYLSALFIMSSQAAHASLLTPAKPHQHPKGKIEDCPFYGTKFGSETFECDAETTHERAKRLGVEPDEGTTTLGGCQCDSVCGATIEDNYNCDWCYTKDNCGSYTVGYGYWDWCLYDRLPAEDADYQSKTNDMWIKLSENITPADYPNVLYLLQTSVQTSFDDQWDLMPAGRQKYIHGSGVVCMVNFEVTAGNYTGIFKQGTQHGFIRLSSAGEATTSGINPGIGYKFMRTNQVSADWVSLFDLDGQTTFNYFLHNQTNHIHPPSGIYAVLAQKFKQSSNCESMVGLSNAARYDQDGVEYDDDEIEFPYMLKFVPTNQARTLIPDNVPLNKDTFLDALEEIPAHYHLLDVFAKPSPASPEAYLGSMTTTTECTSSMYGDTKFFIRHQRMEEDFAIKRNWLGEMDMELECGNDIGTVPPPRCIDKPGPSLTEILKKKLFN